MELDTANEQKPGMKKKTPPHTCIRLTGVKHKAVQQQELIRFYDMTPITRGASTHLHPADWDQTQSRTAAAAPRLISCPRN